MKSVCAITGSNGYVGGAIKNNVVAHEWETLDLVRQPQPGALAAKFQLGQEISPATFSGVTALVHCAYDFKPLGWDEIRAVNVTGTEKLFQAARAAGVKQIVCISSISAYDGCRSLYGKAKLEIERIAFAHGAVVVRPGLVYGDGPGGMFGKLTQQVRKSSTIPLIGDGSQIQYLVHDEDLAQFVLAGIEGKLPTLQVPVIVANSQPWKFRQLLETIAAREGRRIRLVPLPWRLVWLAIKCAELCGVRLNFRSDSLVSLMYQNPNPSFEELKKLGFQCRAFK
jgi:nucleoside-diphosphate-sugar epimerase